MNFRKIIIFLYLTIIAIFLWKFFQANKSEFLKYADQTNLPFILAAMLLFAPYTYFLSKFWQYIQQSEAEVSNPPSRLDWYLIYLYGFISKYIPGKISLVISRIIFLTPYGYSSAQITTASIIEQLSVILFTVFFSCCLLLIYPIPELYIDTPVIALVLSCYLALPFLYKPAIQRLKNYSWARSLLYSNTHIYKNAARICAAFVASMFIGGAVFYLFELAIFQQTASLDSYMKRIVIINVSSIASLLAFFVPSGIGVREGVIILALGPTLGFVEATSLSILYRLFTSFSEILILGLLYSVIKIHPLTQNNKVQQ